MNVVTQVNVTQARGRNMLNPNNIAECKAQPVGANITTKAELLSRAKAAIDEGETSLCDAAEALALAKEDFKATQREMAEAVGRSASWVNRLLKWRRSGYEDHSPFGPTTKAGRVAHAKQRADASKLRKPATQPKPENHNAVAAEDSTNAEPTKRDPGEIPTSTVVNPLEGFRIAVDYWFSKMDRAAKEEAITYAVFKARSKA